MDEPKKSDQFGTSNSGNDAPQGGNVMDIQSPKPASDTAPNLPDSSASLENSETPSAVPVTSAATNETSQTQPVAEPTPAPGPSSNSADFAAALASEPNAPDSGQSADPAPNPLAIPPQSAPKAKARL